MVRRFRSVTVRGSALHLHYSRATSPSADEFNKRRFKRRRLRWSCAAFVSVTGLRASAFACLFRRAGSGVGRGNSRAATRASYGNARRSLLVNARYTSSSAFACGGGIHAGRCAQAVGLSGYWLRDFKVVGAHVAAAGAPLLAASARKREDNSSSHFADDS